MAAAEHVDQFLRNAEGADEARSEDLLGLVDDIVKRADRDDDVRRLVADVSDWARSKSVDSRSYDEYKKLHDRETELGERESAGVGLAAALLHGRATKGLGEPGVAEAVRDKLRDGASLRSAVTGELGRLEPDFAGELMLRGERRKREDKEYAKQLKRSHAEVKRLMKELKRRHPDKDRESGPEGQVWIIVFLGGIIAEIIIVAIIVIVIIVVIVWLASGGGK
ncbi:MAG: hypothetical protein M3340_12595 [Actinomycetota bacterium]|nr:hypothetical protein [Actinomycetota bacterium]